MVAHLLWEQRVAGSNPVTPTNRGHSAAVFSYEPGGVHAVLSHHHDGHDSGARACPRRSRGRRPLRHPARILGHRHSLRPPSCEGVPTTSPPECTRHRTLPRPREWGRRGVRARVVLRTPSGQRGVDMPTNAPRMRTLTGPWRTLSELLCARNGRSPDL